MNFENSKKSDPHRLLLNLSDKINLNSKDKYIALSNLTIYYTWKKIKKSCKNNKFKTSDLIWNEVFELPDGSYSVSDVQGYFKYIIKKHETNTDNPSIMIYVNKTENRITIKIKTGYYFELLTLETMKFLGSTKSKTNENGGNLPHLEIVLIHCNIIIVNNDYQQNSRVLFTIVFNKLFGQLLDISPQNLIFLKTFHAESWYIKV